ncbi:helix-turn-helix transcriptional regulator [Nitrobacter sp.]|uniref:helix-turn-helix domain-containing protein n=1 Tax=Nitrobacter sp. TaxID=29420 RepID=UPI001DB2CE74|nr:helix-turn-helix transcriptional regulator [Nitrobacter sp.]MCB1394299.1 helix-turn-helix transcriptional regulator [Nitrobacter sp.]
MPKRRIFLREWRKHLGAKAVTLAEALGIEEKSYYRVERETWRLNVPGLETLADSLGIRPDQFWYHPPTGEDDENISLDHLVEGESKDVKLMAVKAVKGMVGK